jgi:hypothetical protein
MITTWCWGLKMLNPEMYIKGLKLMWNTLQRNSLMNAMLGICKAKTNKWLKLRNKCFKDCDFTYWASNLKGPKFH